ncbi:MAG: RHS repeat-associated core domain-containing protein [Bacteroidota bacterium]|nr:RHS repeat-associated core domain-containing protein [Bacteroidota bacterium]
MVVAEYNFNACSVKLGFCDPPTGGETKTVVELIPISEADREGRRRSADDWSYTLDGNDLALFADRGFTGHEHLPWFNLYNMNGRLYDPLVGRFLNADPFIQDPGSTQNYNRYSYCLNNPLRYTDYSGYTWGIFKPFVKAAKWVWNEGLPAIDPMKAFVNFMDWINNETPELREEMANLGIPDFNVGGTVNLDGNVNVNGSIYGREVFNTQNIDRSKVSVQAFIKELAQVRNQFMNDWHDFNVWGNNVSTVGSLFYDWATGTGSTSRTFTNDQVADAMKDAYRVNQAREYFYGKYKDVSNLNGASVTNFKGSFGLVGILRAGLDPIEQYVGSYNINMTSYGNNLNFSLYNNTSFKSFFYGFGPEWNRSTFGPGGNMYQYYNWSEPLRLNK